MQYIYSNILVGKFIIPVFQQVYFFCLITRFWQGFYTGTATKMKIRLEC